MVESSPFRFRLHHLIYAVFYCGLGFWVMTLIAAPLILGSIVLMAAIVIGLSFALARRRSTQQDGLMWILAVAAERGMSLAPALEAYSELCSKGYRRKILSLLYDLERGTELPAALGRTPGVFPADAEVLAKVGSETNLLGGALREAASTRNAMLPVWLGVAWRIEYLLYVVLFIQGISLFHLYYIVPKFQAIAADFGVRLPEITRSMIALGYTAVQNPLVSGGIALLEIAAVCYLPFSIAGWWEPGIPLIDRFLIRRHSALILRTLAWVVDGGKSLSWGVEVLSRWYPTPWVHARLERVAIDVRHGIDWAESLASHGLIRPVDAAVLEAARRVGNLSWAMRETAEAGERRLALRFEMVIQAFIPILLLAIGVVAGLFGAAYFAPLISIIERLEG